jgi:hypothetical protein
MLKRITALCMLVLLTASILLPFADSNAHGFRQNSQVGQRRSSRYRSRAWWRRYRARLRKKRAAAAALAHRNELLRLPTNFRVGNFITIAKDSVNPPVTTVAPNPVAPTIVTTNPVPPTVVTAPVAPTVFATTTITAATNPIVSRVGNGPTISRVENKPTIWRAATNPILSRIGNGPTISRIVNKPTISRAATSLEIETVATSPTNSTLALATRPRTVTLRKTAAIEAATLPTATVITGAATKLPTLTNTPVPTVTAAHATAPAFSNVATGSNNIGNEAIVRSKNSVTPLPGQLSISVVALARPNPAFLTTREVSRLLAGINVADLRRIVIDKMVVAGGWVINDYVREINGARVFVVTARTPKEAQTPAKVWTFFFTESGGRIYSLTTDSPAEHSDRMTKEAERFIGSLQSATQGETPKK